MATKYRGLSKYTLTEADKDDLDEVAFLTQDFESETEYETSASKIIGIVKRIQDRESLRFQVEDAAREKISGINQSIELSSGREYVLLSLRDGCQLRYNEVCSANSELHAFLRDIENYFSELFRNASEHLGKNIYHFRFPTINAPPPLQHFRR